MIILTIDTANPESPVWELRHMDSNGATIESTPLSPEETDRLNSLGNPKEDLDIESVIKCLSDENRRLMKQGRRPARGSGFLAINYTEG